MLFSNILLSCQVEPGALLFPAVFFEPTNKEVLQFELGRTKVNTSAEVIILQLYLIANFCITTLGGSECDIILRNNYFAIMYHLLLYLFTDGLEKKHGPGGIGM